MSEHEHHTPSPAIRGWDGLAEGTKVSFEFAFDAADMARFADISRDYSPLHSDADFARARGMGGPIVYGALLLAQLSRLVGMELPGRDGMWTSVELNFLNPLYVGEQARLDAEVTHRSEAARMVEIKVRFTGPHGVIAKGKVAAVLR